MKLRTKLIVLQVSVIAILMVIIGALIVSLLSSAIPLMERGIATKARACLHSLSADADVGIATEDSETLEEILTRCDYDGRRDVDQRFLALLNENGRLLAQRGPMPPTPLQILPLDAEGLISVGDGFRAMKPVAIEGKRLGSVIVEYSTLRISAWKRLYIAFSIVAVLLVLLSSVVSVFFAIHLIHPLRQMIEHVHGVAAGNLQGKLDTRASDELGQLAADLNTMTIKLRQSRRLVTDASRHAGMAEVASNVLHNVGNVLNSANVSCEVIAECLQQSKVESLDRAAGMLEGLSSQQLVEFFTDDEQSSKLLRFYRVAADHFTAERKDLLEEVASLRKFIDHIKVIVATQQQYARVSQLQEAARLDELADTALQMVELSAGEGKAIEVERAYADDLEAVAVDRHRLLQILINLLANARQALQTSSIQDPRLVVCIERHGANRVRFIIKDNGTGIAPEDLPRVFQHGFSTKKGGHGYGLHASANNAGEMSGSLTCRSDGIGKGAEFILELPYEPAAGVERDGRGHKAAQGGMR